MPTNFQELKRFLEEASLTHEADERRGILVLEINCSLDDSTYRDPDGNPRVELHVRIAEKGEFVAVSAPAGWRLAGCPHLPAVCEAAARVQARTKLIRFDLADDGVLRPNCEIPLEAAAMCSRQLYRGIGCVVQAIRRFDPVFRHAMTAGEVDLTLAAAELPRELPGEFRQIIDLATEAGGFDALARLLGGDDPAATPGDG